MVFLTRVETANGKSVGRSSETNELLDVLSDADLKMIDLSPEQDDALRGWLLVRAEEMQAGQTIAHPPGTNVSIGKTADGRAFVKDSRGEWPPPRLKSDSDLFTAS
jgi:hypothetical protein